MVTHGKNMAWRHHDIFAPKMHGKILTPQLGETRTKRWRDVRKVITPCFIGIFGVAVLSWHCGIRFTLGDTIDVDHAAPQMNAVARDTDRPLHKDEVRRLRIGLEEDDNVATIDRTVMYKWHP